jgi:FlaA1/EpsC-like NDP-sugar epimerase
MESNPCEAVKNNISGTHVTARAAEACGAKVFVLISTDKAVKPSSVMGATKRVAEEIIQAGAAASPRTVFAAVRFGNVLGSNGSVVPLFLDQIRSGGPVKVTHPEVRRYFMLIPEAVNLVLHAATLARGGEIFVLEMGAQMKVLDLARNLIRLSGLRPDRDIGIEFTGLRPGEKLSEELVGPDEVVDSGDVPGILCVRPAEPARLADLSQIVHELESAALSGDTQRILHLLRAAVPTFTPSDRSRIATSGLAGREASAAEDDTNGARAPLPPFAKPSTETLPA